MILAPRRRAPRSWRLFAVIAIAAIPAPAAARECQVPHAGAPQPVLSRQSDGSFLSVYKAMRGAVCSWTLPAGAVLDRLEIIEKPRAARILVNSYSVAFSIPTIGRHVIRLRSYRSSVTGRSLAPLTIALVVDVVDAPF